MFDEKLKIIEELVLYDIPFEYDGKYVIAEGSAMNPEYKVPFDRNGLHATGREAFDGNVWWNEYDAGNGEYEYLN